MILILGRFCVLLLFSCSLPANTAVELSLEDVLCVLQLEGSEGVGDVPHFKCWCPLALEWGVSCVDRVLR